MSKISYSDKLRMQMWSEEFGTKAIIIIMKYLH